MHHYYYFFFFLAAFFLAFFFFGAAFLAFLAFLAALRFFAMKITSFLDGIVHHDGTLSKKNLRVNVSETCPRENRSGTERMSQRYIVGNHDHLRFQFGVQEDRSPRTIAHLVNESS